MNLTTFIKRIERNVKHNSPVILSGFGVTGVVLTAYLSAKAAHTAAKVVHHEEQKQATGFTNKEIAALTWRLYVPAAVCGVVTISCIFGSFKAGTKRTAAAYSLLSVSEKAFDEYKEKVIEQIGSTKEQKIRDSIAQDRVSEKTPVIIAGSGNVMCYEQHTGRYFMSDMEKLKRAQNELNAKLLKEDVATSDDFYYLIGLEPTSHSSYVGWKSSKLMELSFSTVLSKDGNPCLAFEYNYITAI